jgi:hypothetical protein
VKVTSSPGNRVRDIIEKVGVQFAGQTARAERRSSHPQVSDSSPSSSIRDDRPFDSGLFPLRFRIVRPTNAKWIAGGRHVEFFTDDSIG